MDTNLIQVVKRDGSKEPYTEQKIKNVILAAGLSDSEATKFSHETTQAVSLLGKTELTSHEIREIVIDKLRLVNEYAAGLYEWYEKTKDKHQ